MVINPPEKSNIIKRSSKIHQATRSIFVFTAPHQSLGLERVTLFLQQQSVVVLRSVVAKLVWSELPTRLDVKEVSEKAADVTKKPLVT